MIHAEPEHRGRFQAILLRSLWIWDQHRTSHTNSSQFKFVKKNKNGQHDFFVLYKQMFTWTLMEWLPFLLTNSCSLADGAWIRICVLSMHSITLGNLYRADEGLHACAVLATLGARPYTPSVCIAMDADALLVKPACTEAVADHITLVSPLVFAHVDTPCLLAGHYVLRRDGVNVVWPSGSNWPCVLGRSAFEGR